METTVFRFFGLATLLFEVVLAYTMYLSRFRFGPLTPAQFLRPLTFFFVATAAGIGLLFVKRWAAIIMSAATSYCGLWLIIGSILYVPFPFNLINIWVGSLLIMPLITTIGYWSSLKPGGKYYL
jgi:hypothetical protein